MKSRKEYSREWYKKNREKILEQKVIYGKQYYIENRDKIVKRTTQHNTMMYKTNPKYNLKTRISVAINMSLKGNKNGYHWEDLVGYKLINLVKRLKNTMPKGYTWDNFIGGDLHIDHIIPISAFNFAKPEHIDFKRCWALENLRLLPAEENLIKHNKLYKPFQPALAI